MMLHREKSADIKGGGDQKAKNYVDFIYGRPTWPHTQKRGNGVSEGWPSILASLLLLLLLSPHSRVQIVNHPLAMQTRQLTEPCGSVADSMVGDKVLYLDDSISYIS